MDITIDGPVFYHEEDENLFFSCVYELPDFKEVIGQGRKLKIVFNNNIGNEAIMKLLVLCYRWSIETDSLSQFKNETNSSSTLWVNRVEN